MGRQRHVFCLLLYDIFVEGMMRSGEGTEFALRLAVACIGVGVGMSSTPKHDSFVETLVIGGGPAGMAAAGLAAELGLETMLIDEQASPGGQIYKGIERSRRNSPLGPDYLSGRSLAAALRASRLEFRGR